MDDRAGFLVGEGVSNRVGFSELSLGLIVIHCGVSISGARVGEGVCCANDGQRGRATDGFV